MPKPKSVLKNEAVKILCDFEIQTDHRRGSPCGVMVKALDCRIAVSKFDGCQRDPRYFGIHQACLGYDLMQPGSPLVDWVTHGRPCWRVPIQPGMSLLRWQSVMTGILEPQGAVPQALILFGGVGFIAWRLRRMPTGSEAFLELPGVSGLQPCAWTHQKKALCHIHPVGGTYDKYRLNPARAGTR